MIKRVIGIMLCMALLFTMVPTVAFAETQPEVIAEIDQYKLGGESVTVSGVPAYVTTYANGTTTSTDGAVIVYIMNHGGKVVGTESNGSILSTYLTGDNAGKYVVVTVDFLNNPLAVSPTIDLGLQNLVRQDIWSSKKFMYGNSFVKETSFILPEGCRLARDVWYFDLLGNGAKGTKEAIVASWNTDAFKTTHGSKIPPCEGNNFEGGWFEATDISQLVKSQSNGGGPIDTNLCLDIVYPSNPKEKTPVFMHSSSWERRYGSESSAFNIGLGLRGYTVVTYDHEYYPMARDDHYGYYGGAYGTAQQNGVKTHTAASRCVKYYADTYGYDATRICNMGISKAGYTALLGHPDPESLEEISSYSSYGYEKGDNYGEQPFLKDQKGNDLSGHIQVVFTAMGDGAKRHKQLMTTESSPIVTACGYNDQFGAWDYWAAQQQTYKDLDLPNLAMTMMDKGHDAPLGIDPDLKYLREDGVMDFYDYYINNGSPRYVYMDPIDGSTIFDGSKPLKLKFIGEIALSEIENKVTVKNAETNEELDGIWTSCNGNTEFDFVSDEYESNTEYVVTIPNTIKDEKFARNLEDTYEITFTTSKNDALTPVNDAYVVLGEAKITGNEEKVVVSKNKSVGYFEFDLSNSEGIVETGELWLNVENDAVQALNIYAFKDVNWSEATLTKDNAPSLSNATFVGTAKVTESGIVKIDVSEYMADFDGSKVTFAIEAQKESGKKGLVQSFDNLDSFVEQNVSGIDADDERRKSSVSDTWDFKVGGDPIKNGRYLSSDKDHTTGSGKSYYFGRNSTWDRIKLYNTFGTSMLTAADIGDTYRISFWVNPDSDITIYAGLMASYNPESESSSAYYKYDASMYGTTVSQSAKAGEWTKVSFDYTIDQGNIDGRIQMLTIQSSIGTSSFYLDDINVELLATDVCVTSKEGRNLEEGKTTPKLVLTKEAVDLNNPVRIGKTKYASLSAAIAQVPQDGTLTEIKLDADIELNGKLTVAEGKNIYLNLCGKTVDLTAYSGSPVITVNGSLKVDNGTINDEYLASNGIGRGGYVFHALGVNAYLEIGSNARIISHTDYGVIQVGRYDNFEKSPYDVLYGTVVINDGAYIATRWSIVYAYPDGNVTIYGGTFENTSSSVTTLMGLRDHADFKPVRKVYGGNYSTLKTPTDSQYPLKSMTSKCIYGGTFNDKRRLNECVAYGYTYVENDDGTYTVVPKKVENAPLVEFDSASDITITSSGSYDSTKTWWGSSSSHLKLKDGYAQIFGTAGAWGSSSRIGFTTNPTAVKDKDSEQYMVCKIQIHPGNVKTRYRLGHKTDDSTSCANVFCVYSEEETGKLYAYTGKTDQIDTSAKIGEPTDYYGDMWIDCVAVIDLNTESTNAPVTLYANDIKGTGSLYADIATRARSGELLGIFLQNEHKASENTFIDNARVYTVNKNDLVKLNVTVDDLTVTTSNEVMIANLKNTSDETLSVIKANGQYLPMSAIKVNKGGLSFVIDEDDLAWGDNEIDLSEVKDIFGQNIDGDNTFVYTKEMPVVEVIGEDIKASYDDGKGANTVTNRFFANLVNIEDIAEAGFEISTVI
ncbi:MAG: hypothetical protein E7391_09395, partial [Ruminococcaceae bacterium]|nr:hypothetical protein [Oscillospiraceae bacterium]